MSANSTFFQFVEGDASIVDWYGVFFYKRVPIRGSALALWFYALFKLCLRFLSRRLSKAGFWYDDWLLTPAMVSNVLQSKPRLLTCMPALSNGDVLYEWSVEYGPLLHLYHSTTLTLTTSSAKSYLERRHRRETLCYGLL